MGGFAKGIVGGQGDFFQPDWQARAGDQAFKESEYAMGDYGVSPFAGDLLKGYTRGESGLAAMGNANQATQRALAESPVLGSLIAQDILQQGPITSMMYGKQGELSKALGDVDTMRKPGAYGLTASDQNAYGQMSGDLARMFGNSEQGLAQDLASRGLAGAQSGVAAKEYGGLQGNKMEQFAGLQRQIADQAMQRAIQRDSMLRNYALQMQGMAGNDIQNQFGRQLAGVGSARGAIMGAAQMENQRNVGKAQADLASAQDKRAAYAPGLGEMFAAGLGSSAFDMGASPGTGSQAFSQSFGSGLGGGLSGMAGGGMMGGGGMGGGGGSQTDYSYRKTSPAQGRFSAQPTSWDESANSGYGAGRGGR